MTSSLAVAAVSAILLATPVRRPASIIQLTGMCLLLVATTCCSSSSTTTATTTTTPPPPHPAIISSPTSATASMTTASASEAEAAGVAQLRLALNSEQEQSRAREHLRRPHVYGVVKVSDAIPEPEHPANDLEGSEAVMGRQQNQNDDASSSSSATSNSGEATMVDSNRIEVSGPWLARAKRSPTFEADGHDLDEGSNSMYTSRYLQNSISKHKPWKRRPSWRTTSPLSSSSSEVVAASASANSRSPASGSSGIGGDGGMAAYSNVPETDNSYHHNHHSKHNNKNHHHNNNNQLHSQSLNSASSRIGGEQPPPPSPLEVEEVLSASRSMARNIMKRRPRGRGRMYDVPQIGELLNYIQVLLNFFIY